MQLNINNLSDYEGQIVYICDFRYKDIFKKPIRHVVPVEVLVHSKQILGLKKTTYYSNFCFVPMKNGNLILTKAVSPFDNTGFRSYEGEPVKIFDNMDECVQEYKKMCEINSALLDLAVHEFRNKVDSVKETIASTLKNLL